MDLRGTSDPAVRSQGWLCPSRGSGQSGDTAECHKEGGGRRAPRGAATPPASKDSPTARSDAHSANRTELGTSSTLSPPGLNKPGKMHPFLKPGFIYFYLYGCVGS